ncbi:DUF6476 family protein [Paenirhodobacter sp.]|uniref:DUF6476 family protein n=1 Tax=Paenirhodobacter sp. TaxID=1965326 RepID=UPI003B40FB8F
MPDMTPSDPAPLPEVRFLKMLVTALAVTMILGLVTIVGLLVTRLRTAPPLPVLPEVIRLPEGARVEALTFARGHTVVVTTAGEVLIYRADGTLARTVAVE